MSVSQVIVEAQKVQAIITWISGYQAVVPVIHRPCTGVRKSHELRQELLHARSVADEILLRHLHFSIYHLGLASFGSGKLSDGARVARVAWWEQSPHSAQAVISHFLASQGQSRSNALAQNMQPLWSRPPGCLQSTDLDSFSAQTPFRFRVPQYHRGPSREVPSIVLCSLAVWARQEREGTHGRKRSVH